MTTQSIPGPRSQQRTRASAPDKPAPRPAGVAPSLLAALAALALPPVAACGTDTSPRMASGTGGAAVADGGEADGGSGGAAGMGGAPVAPASTPTCVPTASTLGVVTSPSPLISVGKPVTAKAGVQFPDRAVDGKFPHDGVHIPAAALPAWVAVQVGTGPARLLLSWVDSGWGDYTSTVGGRYGGAPTAYRIEVSGDSTNGEDGTWQTVIPAGGAADATVVNTVRERAHSFPFAGKSWVRMVVTAAGSSVGADIDEISLHDASASNEGPIADTWFFMGDSITAGAFRRDVGPGFAFDEIVRARRPTFSPVILNGGIGGELSAQGLAHIDSWLELNPDIQHIAILYGTNDSWGDKVPSATTFEANMRGIIQKVRAAGRVPILARIPYALVAHRTLPAFQTIVDDLSAEFGLPCGPDLYTWFRDNPGELNTDGVHPHGFGNRSINRLWAESMLRFYPAAAN